MFEKNSKIYVQKIPHYKQSLDFSFCLSLELCFSSFRYEIVHTQRNRDKQRLSDLEKALNEEKQNRLKFETQIKTERTLTKKLQDDLTKLSLTPPRLVSISKINKKILFFYSLSRSECTEQCLKRKRDQENEIRELRKIFNDKDERIKLLDNEIKVYYQLINQKMLESEISLEKDSELKESFKLRNHFRIKS